MNSSFGTGNWSIWINNSSSGQPPSSIFFEFHILKTFSVFFLLQDSFVVPWFYLKYYKVWNFSPQWDVWYFYFILITVKKNVHHTSAKIFNNNLNIVFQCKNMHSIPLTQPLLLLRYLQIILCYYSSYRISPLYESHSTYQYGQTFSQDHPYRCLDC